MNPSGKLGQTVESIIVINCYQDTKEYVHHYLMKYTVIIHWILFHCKLFFFYSNYFWFFSILCIPIYSILSDNLQFIPSYSFALHSIPSNTLFHRIPFQYILLYFISIILIRLHHIFVIFHRFPFHFILLYIILFISIGLRSISYHSITFPTFK